MAPQSYGSVVSLTIPAPLGWPTGKVQVPGFVLQSITHPITDDNHNPVVDGEGKIVQEEHLTVAYLDPGKGVEVMSGIAVQNAFKTLYSVRPVAEDRVIGWQPAHLAVNAPVIGAARPKPNDPKGNYSAEDPVMGCSVKVDLDDRFIQVSVGGRDHVWDRSNGEHSSGAHIGQPIPMVAKPDNGKIAGIERGRYPVPALPSASDLDRVEAEKALAEAPADDTRKLQQFPSGTSSPISADIASGKGSGPVPSADEHHESFKEKLKDLGDGIGNALGEAFEGR